MQLRVAKAYLCSNSYPMSEGLVLIPTYNERENAELIIRKVMSLPRAFDVLIIDDGSPDGTAAIVRGLQAEFPGRLFLEERGGKQGLGTAYIHGFRWALAHDYEYVFEMDADLSHNPDDLLRLHDACAHEGYDLAIGSRYIQGVNVVNWPMSRVLMSYFASWYVRLITGMPISDATAGFKCYTARVLRAIDLAIGSRYIQGVNVVNWPMSRVLMSYFASWYVRLVTGMPIRDATAGFKCYTARVLRAIDLANVRFVGYAFQIEMKWLAYQLGFRIKEVPIIFTDRTRGTSKMSSGIVQEAFFGVLQMKISSWVRPRKPAATR